MLLIKQININLCKKTIIKEKIKQKEGKTMENKTLFTIYNNKETEISIS